MAAKMSKGFFPGDAKQVGRFVYSSITSSTALSVWQSKRHERLAAWGVGKAGRVQEVTGAGESICTRLGRSPTHVLLLRMFKRFKIQYDTTKHVRE